MPKAIEFDSSTLAMLAELGGAGVAEIPEGERGALPGLTLPKGETPRTLVSTYFRYRVTHSEADFWAWNSVTEIVVTHPTAAWTMVVALLHVAPTPGDLAYVAAGPLEDLLCRHGPAILPALRADASRLPRLREGLKLVWGHRRMAPEVLAELRLVLSGERW